VGAGGGGEGEVYVYLVRARRVATTGGHTRARARTRPHHDLPPLSSGRIAAAFRISTDEERRRKPTALSKSGHRKDKKRLRQ
jgi:hypothetical protein